MSKLIWIGILFFNLVQLLWHYFEDVFVRIIFLRNGMVIEGKIIYFDECYIHESRFDLSIVEYDKSKRIYVVSRGVGDKIGDKIKIVTDGKIAIRKCTYNKFEMESHTFIEVICIVIAMIGLRSNMSEFNGIDLIFSVSVLVFTILINSVAYIMQMKQIRKKMGMYNS